MSTWDYKGHPSYQPRIRSPNPTPEDLVQLLRHRGTVRSYSLITLTIVRSSRRLWRAHPPIVQALRTPQTFTRVLARIPLPVRRQVALPKMPPVALPKVELPALVKRLRGGQQELPTAAKARRETCAHARGSVLAGLCAVDPRLNPVAVRHLDHKP